jgi:cytosine/adenosine deaminase-related metal-dependent hydrolase
MPGLVRNLFCDIRKLVPRLRPVPYLASLGVLAARPLLVHAVQVTDADVRLIAESGCAVVHCPRTNSNLACGQMPLAKYVAAGVPVYLGTDGLASSPDVDVRAERAFAAQLHGNELAAALDKSLTNPFPPA